MKTRLVYFGSSHHSIPALDALFHDVFYEIVGIVSQPDKPVGRKQVITPTPVSAWALEHGVPLLRPDSWRKDLSALDELRNLHADVAVLCIYGKILPQNVLDTFLHGIINIHPSILPTHRGPAPAVGAILSGDIVSGVTIMRLVAEMDAGPVLGCREFPLLGNETPDSYYTRAFSLGAALLLEVLPPYLDGSLVPREQDHARATYTHILSRDDGKIDWSTSSLEIERKIRAFSPWPGTWTEVWIDNDGNIKLEREMAERIGYPFDTGNWDGVHRKRMKILSAVLENDQLRLDRVQIEGDKPVLFHSLLKE